MKGSVLQHTAKPVELKNNMFNTKSEDTYFKSYFSLTFNGPIFCWKIPMIPKRQRNNDTPLSIEATRENTP